MQSNLLRMNLSSNLREKYLKIVFSSMKYTLFIQLVNLDDNCMKIGCISLSYKSIEATLTCVCRVEVNICDRTWYIP